MKEFHNPAVMDQIARMQRIDQHATNFPRAVYDPAFIERTDHYQLIARKQARLEARAERERAAAVGTAAGAQAFKASFAAGGVLPPSAAGGAAPPSKRAKTSRF